MSPFKEILERFERVNREQDLLGRSDRILVAASGGPDSQALLFVLAKLSQARGWSVEAAHLSHGLSPQAGLFFDRASRLCSKLGVLLHAESVDVRALASRRRKGIEEAGRQARYDFFLRTAARRRCNRLATAHTLDDQAETVLMRILRGCGLQGAAGIPPSRRQGRVRIVRPLIGCSKPLLRRLLRAEKIPYAVDRSNRDDAFTRNRIRLRTLPYLRRQLNPSVDEALADLGRVSAEAYDYIRLRAAAVWRSPGMSSRSGGSLSTGRLARLHPALRTEVLRMALEAARGNRLRITRAHVLALCGLLDGPRSGATVVLPGGATASLRAGRLVIDTPRE